MTVQADRARRRAKAMRAGNAAFSVACALAVAGSGAWLAYEAVTSNGSIADADASAKAADDEAARIASQIESIGKAEQESDKSHSAVTAGQAVAEAETSLCRKPQRVAGGSRDTSADEKTLSDHGLDGTPWIQLADDDVSWELLTSASYDGGEIPVCWKATKGHGDVAGYATATYDSDSDSFSGLSVWSAP